MVGHLFCRISADVSQYTHSAHLPQKDGTLSPQFMTHSGGFVCTVCDKWHARQVNYSPLQHCTADEAKYNALHGRGDCDSAQHDPGLVWQRPAVFGFLAEFRIDMYETV